MVFGHYTVDGFYEPIETVDEYFDDDSESVDDDYGTISLQDALLHMFRNGIDGIITSDDFFDDTEDDDYIDDDDLPFV